MEVFYPWLEEARAWVAVASGDLSTAAEVLRLLAARTRSDGFAGIEMFALYHLGRLGRAGVVCDRLDALVAHRRAAHRPGDGLARAGDRAARTAAACWPSPRSSPTQELNLTPRRPPPARSPCCGASARRRRPGPRSASPSCASSAPPAVTPALVAPQPMLTGRERQIARLAAAGVAVEGDRGPALPVLPYRRQPPHAGLRQARCDRSRRTGRGPALAAAGGVNSLGAS